MITSDHMFIYSRWNMRGVALGKAGVDSLQFDDIAIADELRALDKPLPGRPWKSGLAAYDEEFADRYPTSPQGEQEEWVLVR